MSRPTRPASVRWILAALVVGVVLILLAILPRGEERLEESQEFLPERVQLPVEPTTQFPIKPVREARDALNPAELVLGVTIGNASRAYPINLLNEEQLRYKVLNDTLGGRPIAATWCNACFNAIVYDREVDGETLTLGVSGQLWKESMVLYDLRTHSLWSHLLGEAKQGVLKGKRLRRLPSVLTDWESWRREHPDGTIVLAPYQGSPYRRDGQHGRPEEFVLGIAEAGKARHWGFDTLSATPAINDEWSGQPVVAVFDRQHFTARLYDREVAGRRLTFLMAEGKMTDRETGSVWEPVTGRATAGPLAGRHLVPLPATVSYGDAWRRFFPQSE